MTGEIARPAQNFRDAMSRLGAAVNLVTTDGPAGRFGVILSAVCSVSDQPPTMLACVNRESRANRCFRTNGKVCINILSSRQRRISDIFTDRNLSIDERFDRCGPWQQSIGLAPSLPGALASIHGFIVRVCEVGSHTIFACEIEQILLGPAGEALIYFARDYHRINPCFDDLTP